MDTLSKSNKKCGLFLQTQKALDDERLKMTLQLKRT